MRRQIALRFPLVSGAINAPQPVEEIPVSLKLSSSGRRKPSFYIPRMREGAPDPGSFAVDNLGSALPLFAITSPTCEYFALRLPLLKAGFKRLGLAGGDVTTACNAVWGKSHRVLPRGPLSAPGTPLHRTSYSACPGATSVGPDGILIPGPPSALSTLALNNPFQKFNHYPGSHRNLGCKRGMAKNIMHAEAVIARAAAARGVDGAADMYSFSPRTWFYPDDAEALQAAFRAAPPSRHFIWKPARGSCGRGILLSQGGAANEASWRRVMAEIAEKSAHESVGRVYRHYVVQEYLEDPLLLEGRKMDLRLYVTVTSYNPLTVYLHEEGLVRLAAEPYDEPSGPSSGPADGSSMDTDRCVVSQEQADRSSTDPASSFEALFGQSVGHQKETPLAGKEPLAAGRFRYLTNYSVGRKYQSYRQQQQQMAHQQGLSVSGIEWDARCPVTPAGQVSVTALVAVDSGPELKWSMAKLWHYLDGEWATGANDRLVSGVPPSSTVQGKISLLIVRTLLAARPNLLSSLATADVSCSFFELYGFDVMLDERLEPFLIEINTLPSLESSSDFDYATKCNVVSDLLNLAMLEPFERDPATLEVFTNNPMHLAPPGDAVKPFVHGLGDRPIALASLDRSEQRAEIQTRLGDELMYARGFKRIFPPLPGSMAVTAGEDLNTFSSLGMLTKLDECALGL